MSQVALSICSVPEELYRTQKEVQRKIDIYKRKCVDDSIEALDFVTNYVYLLDGQRFTKYEFEADLSTILGKLLKSYPKLDPTYFRVVNEVVTEDEVEDVFVFSQPLREAEPSMLQSISVAPRGGEYDFILDVKKPRASVTHPSHPGYIFETWDESYLDIVQGPNNIERKPYRTRREVLQSFDLPLVPFLRRKSIDALYIRDSDPYSSGGRGGYAFYSPNQILAVEQEVFPSRCDYYVKGSLSPGFERTLVSSCVDNYLDDAPPRSEYVLINLTTQSVLESVNYIHDVIDYCNVQHCLPRTLADIHIRHSREYRQEEICRYTAVIVGSVTQVGFRRQMYDLFFGSRVRMRVLNVNQTVFLEGYTPALDFSSFQYKVEALAYSHNGRVSWESVEKSSMESCSWEIRIEGIG